MRVIIRIQPPPRKFRRGARSSPTSGLGLHAMILASSMLSCLIPIIYRAKLANSATAPRFLLTLLVLEALICLVLLISRIRLRLDRFERRQAWILLAAVRQGRV